MVTDDLIRFIVNCEIGKPEDGKSIPNSSDCKVLLSNFIAYRRDDIENLTDHEVLISQILSMLSGGTAEESDEVFLLFGAIIDGLE